jgi:hypothetical protein
VKLALLIFVFAALCAGCQCAQTCEGCWLIGHPLGAPCEVKR